MCSWETETAGDKTALFLEDGEQIKIITAAGTYYVKVFWKATDEDGSETIGPRFWVAASDLPSDFARGDSVTYNAVVYTVSHQLRDGHGIDLVTLHSV